MARFTRLLAITGLLCATALPAHAASIIYTGSQQVGSIHADFTVTTDGTLGTIDQSNFMSFSIQLSDAFGSYAIDQTTSAITAYRVEATATTLSINDRGQLSFVGYDLTSDGRSVRGGLIFVSDSAGAQIADDVSGRRDDQAVYPLGLIIATSAPGAVPEPASWAMMLGGFGAIGGAMRSRKRQTIQLTYS